MSSWQHNSGEVAQPKQIHLKSLTITVLGGHIWNRSNPYLEIIYFCRYPGFHECKSAYFRHAASEASNLQQGSKSGGAAPIGVKGRSLLWGLRGGKPPDFLLLLKSSILSMWACFQAIFVKVIKVIGAEKLKIQLLNIPRFFLHFAFCHN